MTHAESRPVTDLTGRRLLSVLAAEQAEARLPSVVSGVVRDGALVWTGARGRVTGSDDPPSPDLQYRIGSITKTLTAVLVMQLRNEGLLDLNAPVETYLPGITYGDRTVRSLLSHSSGMQSEPTGPWWERTPGGSFAELAGAIDGSRAAHPAGATFHYTNLAFGMLGEVVSRLRGTTWWEAVAAGILQPLGMRRTSYLPAPPAATGYSVHHFAGTLDQEPSEDTGAMAPAGQVWSTVEDLARYAAFLVAGHQDVLPDFTLDEMCTPQSGSLLGGVTSGYGLGMRLLAGGSGTLVGHTGSMPGFLAGLFVDRSRRTAAVVLANGTNGMRCEGLPRELLTTLEELEPTLAREWRPVQAVPEALQDLLGVWHWGNTAYGFSYERGQLVARQLASGQVSYRFRLGRDGTVVGSSGYHHGERLEAVRNAEGSVNHLRCATFIYTRTPYDPQAPIPGGPPA
jgi:CubicO group peptidase (beta-lactamase class C family)